MVNAKRSQVAVAALAVVQKVLIHVSRVHVIAEKYVASLENAQPLILLVLLNQKIFDPINTLFRS